MRCSRCRARRARARQRHDRAEEIRGAGCDDPDRGRQHGLRRGRNTRSGAAHRHPRRRHDALRGRIRAATPTSRRILRRVARCRSSQRTSSRHERASWTVPFHLLGAARRGGHARQSRLRRLPPRPRRLAARAHRRGGRRLHNHAFRLRRLRRRSMAPAMCSASSDSTSCARSRGPSPRISNRTTWLASNSIIRPFPGCSRRPRRQGTGSGPGSC